MKLKLYNFRCYIEKEFEFGDTGLVLLSGPSGSGKSTLMMAILFVLFGTGTKITTFGKKNCKVILEYKNLVITRTKSPNRVVLFDTDTDEEFEDDSAQGIINKYFGESFEKVSYVEQNTFNSFIKMSPADKLDFLEKFAFQGINLSEIKSRCNAIIRKTNEELIKTSAQLELSEENFKNVKKPENIDFPFRVKDKEKASKNETIKFRNTEILIKRAEKRLTQLIDEKTDTNIFLIQKKNKTELINSITEKIEQNILDKNTTYYQGDEKLENLEKKLKLFLSQKEIIILREKYELDKKSLETLQENEIEDMTKEIKTIEMNLWKEYGEKELIDTIEEYQQISKDSEKLSVLEETKNKCKVDEEKLVENKQSLKSLQEKLIEDKDLLQKLIMQKETYQCPSCNTSLRFQDKQLVFSHCEIPHEEIDIDELKNNINNKTKTINKLQYLIPEEENKLKRYNQTCQEIEQIKNNYESDIPSKTEAEETIEYLKEYKKSQLELEKKKKKLENNINDKVFSSTVEMFKNQILKQKEKIRNLESLMKFGNLEDNINEEELRQDIQIQRQNKDKISVYEKNIKNLSQELKTVQDSLDHETEMFSLKYKEIRDVENDLISTKNELETLKNNLTDHSNNLSKIEQYNKNQEEIKKYKDESEKIEKLREDETKNRKKYSSALMLRDKIAEAESISVTNIINSINIHVQDYLDLFFPNDPIVIRLCPFKTTKKNENKPQINLEIDYKGMEAEINMLSGGELARVVVAFTLALAEIFNAPFLLLDEPTASLDQEATTIVMEGIKNNFGDKLTIVIAHQVVSGNFDREINL
jgi:exonuclease SbcC